jgi:hypothetical protein
VAPRRKAPVKPAIDEWARLISAVLGRVAEFLIEADLPAAFLEEISRVEYTRAACARARRPSGSVNRSQIAAITGLSRPEVTRLLAKIQSSPSEADTRHPISRSARVVSGWLSDSRFCVSQGIAAPLPYEGGSRSFTQLVKTYAGDVPPRALLERLELLGIVSVVFRRDRKSRYIEMTSTSPRRDGARRSLAAINQLLDCLAMADGSQAAPRLLRADLHTSESASQAVTLRAATAQAEAFLAGLRESLSTGSRQLAHGNVRIVMAIAPVERGRSRSPNPARKKKPRSLSR